MRFLEELGSMASWEALGRKAAVILTRIAKKQMIIADIHEEIRYQEVVGWLDYIEKQDMGKVPS